MRLHARSALAALAFAAAAAIPASSSAYSRYNDGCQNCHGAFTTSPYTSPAGGAAWTSSLHETHRSSAYMNAACDLCHTNGDNRNPYLKSSNGTVSTAGYGCTGCHGNLYSGVARGAGLRARHNRGGVTSCAVCHAGDPTPVPESVKPPYYGIADARVASSCNDDSGTTEDWSGDNLGLDNDGDGVLDGSDPDCSLCGNGTLDSGETCDPPGTCPSSCNDSNACTTDVMAGSAATCDVRCTHTAITACSNGDGCCPGGCNAVNDSDCAPSCGNAVVETGEICDPPGSCPSSCDDSNQCTIDALTGSPATCDASCTHTAITACTNGDGCCPATCSSANDHDCSASCGDGTLDLGETCDPPSSCPSTCADADACTTDVLSGSTLNCNAACAHTAITVCFGEDGCCPAACHALNDSDCAPACGNGVLEPGESCDPPSSCPSSCDDSNACTTDVLSGSTLACNATCAHEPITTCTGGDGCCPSGCNVANDPDCPNACGNGILDTGESCDPPSSCPSSCDDSNSCTSDLLTGSAATCNATCSHSAVTACTSGDGCCPSGCEVGNDSDCPTQPQTQDGAAKTGCGCSSGVASTASAILWVALWLGLEHTRRRLHLHH